MAETTADDLFGRLRPLRTLRPDLQNRLANRARVQELLAGQPIRAEHESGWLVYVISGKVSVFGGGSPQIISAGTARACDPLFAPERPQDYATTLGPCLILRVDRHAASLGASAAGYEINDVHLSETESSIFHQVYAATVKGELTLPNIPDVAVRVQKAAADEKINAHQLARIVQMDMAIAGGLIHTVNSPLYRGSKHIGNVRDAIVRLGLDTTRRIVTTMAIRRVFKARMATLKKRLFRLWDRSVNVSALCYVIARRCGSFDPELAMLAGLLHHVGVVPILDYVSGQELELTDDALETLIHRLHPMVGEMVVNYWGLGPEIAVAVRESDHWFRNPDEGADYCDIVIVAELYQHIAANPGDSMLHFDDVPAYLRLGLGLPERQAGPALIHEARDEIDSILRLLKGF
ncbi:MAG: HDOD domain-containing protein [Chromatiales bacterium]|jgi:HD-like signal output (HDOD) protein|nr:HDOD domain-containing protein [Chromatiales bacterium]MDX9766006.1 HDOD domain-containing protein [Ectothiorhodospiraceae bacterium]